MAIHVPWFELFCWYFSNISQWDWEFICFDYFPEESNQLTISIPRWCDGPDCFRDCLWLWCQLPESVVYTRTQGWSRAYKHTTHTLCHHDVVLVCAHMSEYEYAFLPGLASCAHRRRHQWQDHWCCIRPARCSAWGNNALIWFWEMILA